jgi:CDP-paratose 2-epimerase
MDHLFQNYWWAGLILLALAFYKFVLRFFFGMVIVPEDKVGLVTKKFVLFGENKELPDGRIIATLGEAGFQAKTLAPGLYFWKWIWQYEIKKEDFTIIPTGQIGLVSARDGMQLPTGAILARNVNCDDFQDARAFLTNGGQKGKQVNYLNNGVYRINTHLFNIELAEIINIEDGQLGIVTALDGTPLNQGDIAGKSIEGHNNFQNFEIDIRDKNSILNLFKQIRFDVVIHTAAQPSHDKAASIPFDDFETNANGTLHLLEAVRQTNKDCVFIHMSTNKVYGDKPNTLNLVELETRYEYADLKYQNGIDENFSIDQSKHSLFGASKVAADVMVQEYGRYFDIPTCCLRGGCLTGENHSGVELHGFLNYLIKCNVNETKYNVFGYKGKQVRDNIHSSDVIQFMDLFIQNPRIAEVYNFGGGKGNSCSIFEAFTIAESISGKKMVYEYRKTYQDISLYRSPDFLEW